MSGPDPAAGRAENPETIGADRRVLVVGFVAMVAFVAIGVGAAAVFTTSACVPATPEEQDPPGTLTLEQAVADGLVSRAERGELDRLAAELGPVTSVTPVDGAQRLAPTDDGFAVLGGPIVLTDENGVPRAAAAVGVPAQVVGSAPALFSLAWINDLTGQVDAVVPVTADTGLRPDGAVCLDTAVVSEPFAFHLGADAGQLLLLRVEEDADDPELELRDAGRTPVWRVDVEVPLTSPGVLGERLSAALSDEQVLVARRILPDDGSPAVVLLDRRDGTLLRSHDGQRIGASGRGPTWMRALAVVDDLALVVVADGDDRTSPRIVALDDEVRWQLDVGWDVRVAADGPGESRGMVIASTVGGRREIVRVDPGDGRVLDEVAGPEAPVGEPGPMRGGLPVPAPGRVLVPGVTHAVLLDTRSEPARSIEVALVVADAVGRQHVSALLVDADGGTLLVAFAA